MLGRLNHVALAVPDLEGAARLYREKLGAKVSEPESLPEHGVRVVFVDLPNARIELLEPLGENSPIAGFLAKMIMPGKRDEPTGWLGTLLLGIVGAVVLTNGGSDDDKGANVTFSATVGKVADGLAEIDITAVAGEEKVLGRAKAVVRVR